MKTTIVTVILAIVSITAWAAEPSADEIISKANDASYYAGKDGRADVKMTIKDKGDNERVREFTILRLDVGKNDQKFYVYFTAPADVRKMAFLVWKNVGKDDDRWLWIPALNKKKRIAPGDKRTSFVGSDFLYEDVSGRSINDDIHELLETTDKEYKIKNTPKAPDTVEFTHYNVWIDKETFLPRKAEYYNKNGKVYRTVEATKTKTIQGYPTVLESIVKDLESGSSTINVFTNIKYDIGLKERIFTERFLRRPPREVR